MTELNGRDKVGSDNRTAGRAGIRFQVSGSGPGKTRIGLPHQRVRRTSPPAPPPGRDKDIGKTMAQITLNVTNDDGWHNYRATFRDADAVLRFIAQRPDRHVSETEDHQVYPADRIGPLTAAEVELLDYLYPRCHHGLAADLCMDPVGQNHWGTIEQELAGVLG